MKIVVHGDEISFNELTSKRQYIEWIRVKNPAAFAEHSYASAFFNIYDDAFLFNYDNLNAPVFINSVVHAAGGIKNITRINGWKGFLEKDTWEAAGDINAKAKEILMTINKKIIFTKDEPGFISARIIAMIINEAYYAKEEEVSSEDEIDIAMKLGTNYPYGPFEWGRKIGLKNIYDLLIQLSVQDKKYTPAPLLVKLINP